MIYGIIFMKLHKLSDIGYLGYNQSYFYIEYLNAPVICIPGSLGAGDSRDIAGLKCRNLTSDVSRQCRGCVGVLISC